MNILLKIERALSDLRCGVPVILQERNNVILMLAVEGLHDKSLSDFKSVGGKNIFQVITAKRAEALLGGKFQTNIKMAIAEKYKSQQILSIAGVNSSGITQKFKSQQAGQIESGAIKLVKLGEMIPSVLITPVSESKAKSLEKKNGLIKLSLEEIEKFEKENVLSLVQATDAPLKLKWTGDARIIVFRTFPGYREHYAIIVGNPEKEATPLIRIHSSCYTGDLLNSVKCDCRDQLHEALHFMGEHGSGVVLYLMQEGRGIGLVNKLRTYDLQSKGMDTVEANEFLGFDDDERPYQIAAEMLKKMNIKNVRVLTNNPRKVKGLEEFGIKVEGRVPLMIAPHEHNENYLGTKFSKLGHMKK